MHKEQKVYGVKKNENMIVRVKYNFGILFQTRPPKAHAREKEKKCCPKFTNFDYFSLGFRNLYREDQHILDSPKFPGSSQRIFLKFSENNFGRVRKKCKKSC